MLRTRLTASSSVIMHRYTTHFEGLRHLMQGSHTFRDKNPDLFHVFPKPSERFSTLGARIV